MSCLLLLTFIVPLATAVLLLVVPRGAGRVARLLAIAASTISLAATLAIFLVFDRSMADEFQFLSERKDWVESLGLTFQVGVDGINLTLILLAAIVGFAATLVAREIATREKEFFILLMLMIGGIIGAFASLDIFWLYFFHELALIPTFLMIGIWGTGERRQYATFKITIYLSVGALIALIGLLAIYFGGPVRSFNLLDLQGQTYPRGFQTNVFPVLLVGFGILVSLWPFHTWAPIGYGTMPTPTAMIHAGVLKKFGLYALIRIALPLLPEGAKDWMPVLLILCMFNIVYCALVAMQQRDLNWLIGYSSVSHMGYAFLGIASLTLIGLSGTVLLMFAHGIAASLTFALSGYVFERTKTREMAELGGLARKLPFITTCFVMAAMAGVGLPGFANFVSEIMIYFGSWSAFHWVTALAVWGVVLSAVYMLRAVRTVFFGPLHLKWQHLGDANTLALRFPIAVLIVVLLIVGCWPRTLTDIIQPGVKPIAALFEQPTSTMTAEVAK
jgi:NADH-quinone oxidoreductase subunit M